MSLPSRPGEAIDVAAPVFETSGSIRMVVTLGAAKQRSIASRII
jgi:hypothetical protein